MRHAYSIQPTTEPEDRVSSLIVRVAFSSIQRSQLTMRSDGDGTLKHIHPDEETIQPVFRLVSVIEWL